MWAVFLGCSASILGAQATTQQTIAQQIQMLNDAMTRTQAQVEASQRELNDMRTQLTALQRQMELSESEPVNTAYSSPYGSSAPPSLSAPQGNPKIIDSAIQEVRERQALQESQIATLNQSKVESESKYPVKLTGLVLMNGYVNTSAVDLPATPTVALQGPGNTGASVRQTLLGIDARGPHLFGASSHADVRVDFDGIPQSSSAPATYSGYYSANATLLRLRTAHAALQWEHTGAYFSLDRPILSPDTPTSLTAVAEPGLAWSGNLWAWNPQAGVTRDFGLDNDSRDLRLQAALIDVADAPVTPVIYPAGVIPPSTAEQSRWPGVEARVSLLGAKATEEEGNQLGAGGYFAPHRIAGRGFDSWAATLDSHLILPVGLQFTGSFYRGLALGGLGGGAYKDVTFYSEADEFYFRPLDDVGGWTQLKEKFNQRVQLNAAFGIDNAFANELRRYYLPGATIYQNLARNRTYTGNVIYSPSAYLLFSVEYRHLESSPVIGAAASSNIIGLGAGYKF